MQQVHSPKRYLRVRDITDLPVDLFDQMADRLIEQIANDIADELGAGWKITRAEFEFLSDSEIHRYCFRVVAWVADAHCGH